MIWYAWGVYIHRLPCMSVCVCVCGTCQCLYMKSLVKILTISYPFTISLHNQLLQERVRKRERWKQGEWERSCYWGRHRWTDKAEPGAKFLASWAWGNCLLTLVRQPVMGCGFMVFMNEISRVAPTCCAVLYLYKQARYWLYTIYIYVCTICLSAAKLRRLFQFQNENASKRRGKGKLDKMRKQLSSCNYNSIKLCPLTLLSTINCQLAWRAVSNETIGTISHSLDNTLSIAAAIDQLFRRPSIAIGCNFRCSFVANPTMP